LRRQIALQHKDFENENFALAMPIFRGTIMTDMNQAEIQTTVFEYLDELRESGITNMFGASPYLQERFGFSRYDANRFLTKWMETFNERHSD